MNDLAEVPAEDDRSRITLDQIKRVMPKGSRHDLSERVVDAMNDMTVGDNRALYREGIMGYAGVLKEGMYKLKDYVNAVKYVTHKLMGDTNMDAYVKTFPERYQSFLDKEYETRHIASMVSIYNKNQLVNKIMEQTLIPTHIINADLHQEAINRLAYLMGHAKSEKVQGDAAAKLVDALKMPETTKIELDVGVKEDKSIQELKQTMLELAAMQKKSIELGTHSVKDVAHSKLLIDVDAEVVGE